MAARVAQEPRRTPRRHAPHHPPYALMITEAIQSLAEEGGSTESSISSYIKRNFDGLPKEHAKFLPYYLNKLAAQGEFLDRSGRYLLPRSPAGRAEPQSSAVVEPLQAVSPVLRLVGPEGTGRVDVVETAANEGERIQEPADFSGIEPTAGLAGDGDGRSDLVREVSLEPVDDNGVAEEQFRSLAVEGQVGEKCQSASANQDEGEEQFRSLVVEGQVGEKCQSAVAVASANQDEGGEESNLVPEAQGESLKGIHYPKPEEQCQNTVAAANQDEGRDETSLVDETRVKSPNGAENVSRPVPKARGRPPKRKRLPDPAANEGEAEQPCNTLTATSTEPEQAAANRDGQDGSELIPKARGRPPKRKRLSNPTAKKGEAEKRCNTLAVNSPKPEQDQDREDGAKLVPKARGRPCKRKRGRKVTTDEAEAEREVEIIDNSKIYGGDGSHSTSKRLGRPPKRNLDSKPMVDSRDVSNSAPKRRGRPPKGKLDLKSMVDSGDGSDSMPKRLGRPPKRNLDSKSMVDSRNGSDSAPKRLGRPPKRNLDSKSMVDGRDVSNSAPKRHGRPPKRNLDSKSVIDGGDGSNSMCKRLGRPPKRNLDSTAMVDGGNGSNSMPKRLGRPPKRSLVGSGNGSNSAPKRRGRPPKRNPDSKSVVDGGDGSNSMRKRLGRPPKLNLDSKPMVDGGNGSNSMPKRLGRPPKRDLDPKPNHKGKGNMKPSMSTLLGQGRNKEEPILPKRLGRPPKRKIASDEPGTLQKRRGRPPKKHKSMN